MRNLLKADIDRISTYVCLYPMGYTIVSGFSTYIALILLFSTNNLQF